MMGGMGGASPAQNHPNMMPSPMGGHMTMQQHMQQQQQQHSSYMQQVSTGKSTGLYLFLLLKYIIAVFEAWYL